MPQHQSAGKRIRQTERKRTRNVTKRTRLKTAIKSVRSAETVEAAQQELGKTISTLDKMAVKGIIHKNKAANLKSKLTRMTNRKSETAK
jgi:small subunit ribosomal protein S20